MNPPTEPEKKSHMRWYVATVILRCLVDGRECNPHSGVGKEDEKDRPAVYRMVYLLRDINAEVAYQHALDLGRAAGAVYAHRNGSVEFAGLEDLHEFDCELKDGMLLWMRCTHGLSAKHFVRTKEDLSAFFPEVNGWCSFPPEQYWPKPEE